MVDFALVSDLLFQFRFPCVQYRLRSLKQTEASLFLVGFQVHHAFFVQVHYHRMQIHFLIINVAMR